MARKSTDNYTKVNFNSSTQLVITGKFLYSECDRTSGFRSDPIEIISDVYWAVHLVIAEE